MARPPVRPAPPEPTPGGYVPGYVSPHGHLAGLRDRLAKWVDRMGRDRSLPWVGLGLVNDLEVALQLLNLQEFAEWLRVNGPPEHRDFADDILSDQFTLEAVRDACDSAGYRDEPDVVRAIERLDDDSRIADKLRHVFVEVGALDAKDTETDLVALLRALLS